MTIATRLRNAMAWLLRRRRPLWRQCLVYAAMAVVPALASGSSQEALLAAFGIDPNQFERQDLGPDAGTLFATVVAAPLLETLVLGFVIGALSFASRRKAFVAVSSAALWGLAHARLGLLALLPTGWTFFVLSCGYMAWRRDSYRSAFVAAALPHALYNAVLMLLAFVFPGL